MAQEGFPLLRLAADLGKTLGNAKEEAEPQRALRLVPCFKIVEVLESDDFKLQMTLRGVVIAIHASIDNSGPVYLSSTEGAQVLYRDLQPGDTMVRDSPDWRIELLWPLYARSPSGAQTITLEWWCYPE